MTDDDSQAEDIVAEVLFAPSPTGEGICIKAEIGGGATGITDYEIPQRVVPADRGVVLATARQLAGELGRQTDIVVQAVTERRPPPNYRDNPGNAG
jgi:hypothetical protein